MSAAPFLAETTLLNSLVLEILGTQDVFPLLLAVPGRLAGGASSQEARRPQEVLLHSSWDWILPGTSFAISFVSTSDQLRSRGSPPPTCILHCYFPLPFPLPLPLHLHPATFSPTSHFNPTSLLPTLSRPLQLHRHYDLLLQLWGGEPLWCDASF
jgi:hypothetical protein